MGGGRKLEEKGIAPSDRTVGPRPGEVSAGADHTSSPTLPSPPLPPGRKTASLGLYTFFSRQPRSTKSHTSQVVRKVTHFTCQSTYFMKSQITNMSQSRKFENRSQSYFLHFYTFSKNIYIYIYIFIYLYILYLHEYCVYVNISQIA